MIGKEIGPYRIHRLIGKGGMGVVYQGVHTKLDQRVAIKVMTSEYAREEGMRERFVQEAKLQAQLSHPNVVNIFNYLEDESDIFLVMEFVPGRTLEQMLQAGGAISLPETLHIMDGVLSALEFMHGRGIVHRDIKPANIIITESGQVKVTDFGIAKAVGEKGMTRTGTALGTVWYMSPERIRGEPIGHASDIYALGITLYQMVTGQVPFPSDSEYEVMRAHIEEPPPPPTGINADIPQALSDIILKALAKKPQDRFPSAEVFRKAINTVPSDLSLGMQTRIVKDQYGPWAKGEAIFNRLKSQKKIALLLAATAVIIGLLIIFFLAYPGEERRRRLPLVDRTIPAVAPQGAIVALKSTRGADPHETRTGPPDNDKPLPTEVLPTLQELGVTPSSSPESAPEKKGPPSQSPKDDQRKTPEKLSPMKTEGKKPSTLEEDRPQKEIPSGTQKQAPEKPEPKDTPLIPKVPAERSVISAPGKTSQKTNEASSTTPASIMYVRMLQSSDPVEKRKAAKIIYRNYLRDPFMVAFANKELLNSYRKNPNNRHHVDAMSWLCNILGASGDPKFRATLEKVSQDAPHRKLREYAVKNLKKL